MVRFAMEKPQPHIHNIVLILNLDEDREKICVIYIAIAENNREMLFTAFRFTRLLDYCTWLGKMHGKMFAAQPPPPSP